MISSTYSLMVSLPDAFGKEFEVGVLFTKLSGADCAQLKLGKRTTVIPKKIAIKNTFDFTFAKL